MNKPRRTASPSTDRNPLDTLVTSSLPPARLGAFAAVAFDRLITAAESGDRLIFGAAARDLVMFLTRLTADDPRTEGFLRRAARIKDATVRAAVVRHPALAAGERARLVAAERRTSVLLGAVEQTDDADLHAKITDRAVTLGSAKLLLACLTHACCTDAQRARLLAALGPTLRGAQNLLAGIDAALDQVPGLLAVVLRFHGADDGLVVPNHHRLLPAATLPDLEAAAVRVRNEAPGEMTPDLAIDLVLTAALRAYASHPDQAEAGVLLDRILDVLAPAAISGRHRLKLAVARGVPEAIADAYVLAGDDVAASERVAGAYRLDENDAEGRFFFGLKLLLQLAPLTVEQARGLPVAWLERMPLGPRTAEALAQAAGDDPSTLVHVLSEQWDGTVGELLDAAERLACDVG